MQRKGNEIRAPLAIISSPLPHPDLAGGVCFEKRPVEGVIDTIILHSCFVPEDVRKADRALIPHSSAVNPGKRYDFTSAAKELHAQWRSSNDPRFENAGLLTLIEGRLGAAGLESFCVDAIKCMFEFYGVSAHYVIDRAGHVYELVPPALTAFHAGRSKLPHDGREQVNRFSIGIELLAHETSGYRPVQLEALAQLVDQLRDKFPITAIYGHSDIAPDRKTDPWCFDWATFRAALAREPKFYPGSLP